mmetsp:Transcript_47143/g.124954  ORF Transcript_47143/g.124954 Transcript_47143/m.124954 type:complete len:198 (+) Transcript_47143:107-700(+)
MRFLLPAVAGATLLSKLTRNHDSPFRYPEAVPNEDLYRITEGAMDGPFGGQSLPQNVYMPNMVAPSNMLPREVKLGTNPGGSQSGSQGKAPDDAVSIAKKALEITHETEQELNDMEANLYRGAYAHARTLNLEPFQPNRVAPAGPLPPKECGMPCEPLAPVGPAELGPNPIPDKVDEIPTGIWNPEPWDHAQPPMPR